MRIIKFLFGIFFGLLLITIISIPVLLAVFGIESTPLVVNQRVMTPDNMIQIRKLLQQNDPRNLRDGDVKRITITEKDMNLMLDHALATQSRKIRTEVDLHSGSADMRLTVILPKNPVGSYLNISMVLIPKLDSIQIHELHIGEITLPGWLIHYATPYLVHYFQKRTEFQTTFEAFHAVKEILLLEDRLALVFQWRENLASRLKTRARGFIVSNADRERIFAYYRSISTFANSVRGSSESLARFLQPLFQLAVERTRMTGNAEAENEALILSAACYIMGKNPYEILDEKSERRIPKARSLDITLMKRNDLPKHYLISAAIAVAADSGLSNMIGLSKEIEDSRGGTGFSFADLAADRAGIRMGELATASPQQAETLQKRMSSVRGETDFMPRIDRLPEGITDIEFQKKYRDSNSSAFRRVEEEINNRLTSCRVFR